MPMPIRVHCGHCHEDFDEQTVELIDIEENEMGQDLVRFNCPPLQQETQKPAQVTL